MNASTDGIRGKAAIAGVGATEFSSCSGRSELQLASEAILAALADAGLHVTDVDGLVTFAMDRSPAVEVARCLGIPELKFFSLVDYGGGATCGTVLQAAMAVATGQANVVVCYRALNGRSGHRLGGRDAALPEFALPPFDVHRRWYVPYGLRTPASWAAMTARRYMHTYGATSEDFGRVAVTSRRYAATNPRAMFYGRPISLADHQDSRMIVDPLRLLDCCQESDGGVAIAITSSVRCRHLRQPPVIICAAAQGAGPDQQTMTSYYRSDITRLPEMELVARQLWASAGVRATDLQVAILYDSFTPFTLMQLEEFGICARGEGRQFIADGNIDPGGILPVNTHGGQLGEAYMHGMNGIAEAVRQVRGAAANQVAGVEHVLVSAAAGLATSGLILGADR